MNNKERLIVALVILALLVGGFFLWLQGHDARVQMEATITSNAPAIKQAQQQAQDLAKQIQDTNARMAQSQAAVDAKFDKLTSLTQQIAVLAQVSGMKQPPVIVQPGQVPQLPQGGAVITPQQSQELTDYAHGCETCKVENLRLNQNLTAVQGIVAAKQTENDKLRADLQAAQKAAKMGFRYKLLECGKRTLVSTVSGGTTAAVVSGIPGAKKDIGRGFEVGAAVGALSCVILKP